MLALPSPFQETLDARTAFVRKVTAVATRGPVVAELAPSGGQLVQDARRSLRWNGSLSIPVSDDLIPTTPDDLLTPFGTTVEVRLGIVLADGREADVPYGAYDVEKSDVALTSTSRVVNLELVDLGQRLARYRFESPFTIVAGTDVADAVNMVVVDRLGVTLGLAATGQTLPRAVVFGLDPSVDPGRELIELVEGFGYRIWFDRTGSLVLDQTPVGDPTLAIPFEGALSISGAWDNKPPNVMVVRGEASDGTIPVQSVAYDLDSQSPTYAGTAVGSTPYGRVTRFYASPLITNQGQADLAARSMLAGFAAQGAAWTATKPYDPTIDPDDVLTVPLGNTSLPLVVDSVTLEVAGATTVNCRAISQIDGG